MRSYEPLVVPGLMQTEPYARAVIEATSIVQTPSQVEETVSVRISRQRLLHGPGDPIHLVAVLDEAVIRRRIGGRDVMSEQLEHLVHLGALPNVEIRVAPFSAGAHAAMDGKFCLLSFPEPEVPDLLYLEQAASRLVPDDPEQVSRYASMFESLCEMALGQEDSAAFIAQMARRFSTPSRRRKKKCEGPRWICPTPSGVRAVAAPTEATVWRWRSSPVIRPLPGTRPTPIGFTSSATPRTRAARLWRSPGANGTPSSAV